MLNIGQKVIVKKTGEIGEIVRVNKMCKEFYYIGGDNVSSLYHINQIHPLKFEVGDYVRISSPHHMMYSLQGKIESVYFYEDEVFYRIKHADKKWVSTIGVAEKNLEKVEQPKVKEESSGVLSGMFPAWERIFKRAKEYEEKAEPNITIGEMTDLYFPFKRLFTEKEMKEPKFKLGEKVSYDNMFPTWERIFKRAKEYKEMKEPKFKLGEKVSYDNGKIGIIAHIAFKDGRVCFQLFTEDGPTFHCHEDSLKKIIEEPKRYNPLNLEFGERYWYEGWSSNPSILIGSNHGHAGYYFTAIRESGEEYIFFNGVNDISSGIERKVFILYSEYLEHERIKKTFKYPDLVVGKKYKVKKLSNKSEDVLIFEGYAEGYLCNIYWFIDPNDSIGFSIYDHDIEITEHVEPEVKPESKFNYPNLVQGKLYTLSNANFNPYTFVGYDNDRYKFKDCDGDGICWGNLQTGSIKEYQEPYSKEFYVNYNCLGPIHEEDSLDNLTNVNTDGNIYHSLVEAKKNKTYIFDKFKKFRITEVPIDGN